MLVFAAFGGNFSTWNAMLSSWYAMLLSLGSKVVRIAKLLQNPTRASFFVTSFWIICEVFCDKKMSARYYLAWRMVEEERARNLREMRASLRESYNAFDDLPETEFRKRYRLSKAAFIFLCEELRQHSALKSSLQVSLELKVRVPSYTYQLDNAMADPHSLALRFLRPSNARCSCRRAFWNHHKIVLIVPNTSQENQVGWYLYKILPLNLVRG